MKVQCVHHVLTHGHYIDMRVTRRQDTPQAMIRFYQCPICFRIVRIVSSPSPAERPQANANPVPVETVNYPEITKIAPGYRYKLKGRAGLVVFPQAQIENA